MGPLFKNVGVTLKQETKTPYFGAALSQRDQGLVISQNPRRGGPAYIAGLDLGDIIVGINETVLDENQKLSELFSNYTVGDKLNITFSRFGKERTTTVVLGPNPAYRISLDASASKNQLFHRKDWLKHD